MKLWVQISVTSTESFIKEVLSAWCQQIQQSIAEVLTGGSFGLFFHILAQLQVWESPKQWIFQGDHISVMFIRILDLLTDQIPIL